MAEKNPTEKTKAEWDFTRSQDVLSEDYLPLTLRDIVYQGVGGASMCWTNISGAGEFDSASAAVVADKMYAAIEEYIKDQHGRDERIHTEQCAPIAERLMKKEEQFDKLYATFREVFG